MQIKPSWRSMTSVLCNNITFKSLGVEMPFFVCGNIFIGY